MRKSAWSKAAEQHKITAIALPFENESHVITFLEWNEVVGNDAARVRFPTTEK
jgi:hypothetical protein